MKNILIGNGIDIQYGGKEYLNSSIIKRGLNKVRNVKIQEELYPNEINVWLNLLYEELGAIVEGKYDNLLGASYEKISLIEFKSRYEKWKKLKIFDIGIEDYIFIHNLFCRKNNIQNPQQFEFRELLKRFFIDAIYNEGKINEIHKNFSVKLKDFLHKYDNVFTTNYDSNIETFLKDKEVNYLHGAFHILSDVYNPKSFRNKMPDNPIKDYDILDGYDYIYSNALMTFSGDEKMFSMEMNKRANDGFLKLAEGFKNNPTARKDIEEWENNENKLVRNMYQAIKLKSENLELEFNEYYPIEKFKNINGSIDILGLSPSNDNHLFNIINENKNIKKIRFYFFDKSEGNVARKIFKDKEIETLPVKGLWQALK